MKFIDVHAHLEHSRFNGDLDEVISRFEKAGGEFVIESGINSVTNRVALELADRYRCVKASLGLYPVDSLAKEVERGEAEGFLGDIKAFDVDKELDWIKKNKDKCVAIGEIGLDYNWFSKDDSIGDKDFNFENIVNEQKKVFRKALMLAKDIDKPVVVHSRKAEKDAIEVLEELKMKKVVMHCFNGKKSLIKRCVDNGWFFSVPAVITRLDHFVMLVGIVPIEQLLTETDAPYLSPVAGKRNEPANVAITIKEIARIKGVCKEEVAEQIFNNARGLFNL
jgi:TatD DNase family protein